MIFWEKPRLEESWNYTKIESSASQSGTYAQIGSVAITVSSFFDINGSGTTWYRIRFHDSVNAVYSDYSTPILGTVDTDQFTRTVSAIQILGTLNAVGPDSSNNFIVFGMKINQNVAEALVDEAYEYTTELIGETAIASTDSNTVRKVKGFVSRYSALKILGVLNGVGITTHFNYSSGGLNVQKPLIGQMSALMDFYKLETRKWQKLLLSRAIVTSGSSVSAGSSDLRLAILNEESPESGVSVISYDAKNL
jgi:hypothetical protein